MRPYFEKMYQPKCCDKKQWWQNAVFEINFLFQLNDGLKMFFLQISMISTLKTMFCKIFKKNKTLPN